MAVSGQKRQVGRQLALTSGLQRDINILRFPLTTGAECG
jgi:hypothetical protein